MRFPFPGGASAQPVHAQKNLLGSREGWGSLQSPHPSPSCAIQTCWLWLLCPKSSMFRGAQGRQGAGRQEHKQMENHREDPKSLPRARKGT